MNKTVTLESEKSLQEWIIEWFRLQYKPNKALIVHVANENPKGLAKLQAIKYNNAMNLLGRVKGFPDLMVLCNNRVAFFEVKTKTGKLSSEQEEILAQLKSLGFFVAVVRGQIEAKICISAFVNGCLDVEL